MADNQQDDVHVPPGKDQSVRVTAEGQDSQPASSNGVPNVVFGLQEGKGLVEALTSGRRSEAHLVWANMNLAEFNAAVEPDQKDALLDVIVDNARDPEYRDALVEADYGLSVRVGRIAKERESLGHDADALENRRAEVASAASAPAPEDMGPQEFADPAAWERTEGDSDATAPSTAGIQFRPLHASENSIEPAALNPEVPDSQHDPARDNSDSTEKSPETSDDNPDGRPSRGASVRILEALARPFRRAGVGAEANEISMPAVMTSTGYAMPEAIASRYIVLDGSFWQFDPAKSTQSGDHEPTFRDHGPRLASAREDRGTVADMLAVAQAKGWQSVTLKGSESFRRAGWLEATLAGIKTQGFAPQGQDRAMLDAARREREALTISAGRRAPTASPTPDTQTARSTPKTPVENRARAVAGPPGPAIDEPSRAQPAPEPETPARRTEPPRHDVLIAHGKAPYLHDEANSDSYFVTVRQPSGAEKTVWGLDLERAITEADVAPGDAISLANLGSQEVLVHAPIKDDAGQTIGFEEKLARRNVWEVVREAMADRDNSPEPTSSVAMTVATLRVQIEDAIKDQPDNVKRTVLDRLAERLEAGLEVQATHAQTKTTGRDLQTQIEDRVSLVDAERVARTTIEQAAAKRVAPRPEVAKPNAPTVS